MRIDGAFHPSDFEKWRGCDKRFELEVLHGEPSRTLHPKSVNGTAIHTVIEWMHSGIDGWRPESTDKVIVANQYRAAFARAIEHPRMERDRGLPVAWGDYIDEDHARATFATEALDMLKGYANDPRNQTAQIAAMHRQWRAEIDGNMWAGEIDRLDYEPGGTYTICDFKSGAKLNPVPLAMWHQLIYAIGYQMATGNKVKRVRWIALPDYVPYLRSGKTKDGREYRAGQMRGPAYYDVEVNDVVLTGMREEMRMFADAVRAGRFPRRPSNYQCSMCGVSDACVAGFRASFRGVNPSLVAYEGGEER